MATVVFSTVFNEREEKLSKRQSGQALFTKVIVDLFTILLIVFHFR